MKKNHKAIKDTQNEGRNQVELDVDRFINEGLSGGSVVFRENATNIEESRDVTEEEPPYVIED